MTRAEMLCDVLNNQRGLTKWYLKKIPVEDLSIRIEANGQFLNSPFWNVGHLIWTDYHIGLLPMGFKTKVPGWVNEMGFKSSGEIPESMPDFPEVKALFDKVHEEKIEFFGKLSDEVLDAPYHIESLGFKNNYYGLLHIVRHEGVHCGNISAFCKFRGITTI